MLLIVFGFSGAPRNASVQNEVHNNIHEFIEPSLVTSMIGAQYASIIIGLAVVAGSLAAAQDLTAYADEDSIGRGPDSDSDGLSDSFETRLGSDPDAPDSDSDGLADGLEYTGGNSGIPTDPNDLDSDNDGLADSFEIRSGTNPIERDSDGDGLSDSFELASQNTNPLLTDTDEDGVTDNIEVWHGSDPLNPESFFVLPEFPTGPVMMMIASLAALIGYVLLRNPRGPMASGKT